MFQECNDLGLFFLVEICHLVTKVVQADGRGLEKVLELENNFLVIIISGW